VKEAFQARSVALKTSLFHKETKEGEINVLQVLTGLSVLILGVLFYYLFRSADQTYFLKFFSDNPNFKDSLSPGYILIGEQSADIHACSCFYCNDSRHHCQA
jgi:hypothetical protein